MIFGRTTAWGLAAMLSAAPVWAESEPCPRHAAGAAHGADHPCEPGYRLSLTQKADALANVSGGIGRGGVVLMNTDVTAELDLEKLTGWQGGSAFVQAHAQYGNPSINEYAGSFSGISNIETGTATAHVFQAWLQQAFADGGSSLLFGLYAIDSEFYVTESSGLFLQPPYGMSAEMAQSGRNGPPVFPMGALGLRLSLAVDDGYINLAVTDGVPGDPNNPKGTHVQLNAGDGTLTVAEFCFTPPVAEGQVSKTAIGLWHYSTQVPDLVALDAAGQPVMGADQGAYFLAERSFYAHQGRVLSGFFRAGMVNKDAYQADWSASSGLHWQGLWAARPDDEAGVAVTTSHASAKYRQLNGAEAVETVFELTYRAQINDWAAIQPSLQYIHNPNMDPALSDATVAGVRVELSF